MKHSIFAFIIFLSLFLVIGSANADEETRVISLVGDPWPPFMLGELGQEASGGVGVKLMHEIFGRLDSKVELSIPMVPWERALREVKRGSKDGIGILLKTPEREEYMVYTDELFQSYNTLWYTQKNFPNGFEWQSYDDFKALSIGVIRGHSYGEEFDRLVANGWLTSIEVSSAEQLFAMLRKGRFDLAISDRFVGESFVEQFHRSDDNLLAAKKQAHIEIYYIAFSKRTNAKALIPEINKVIAEMKSTGELGRIIRDLPADPETANSLPD